MFFYLSAIASFKKGTAYMMKLAGDESYILRKDTSIRAVLSSDLSDVADAKYAVEVLEESDGVYALRFCDKYITTKSGENGIIASAKDLWKFEPVDDGYKLVSVANKRCLTKAALANSSPYKGWYLNALKCDDGKPNVFLFFEMKDIDFSCKTEPEEICKKLGHVGKPSDSQSPPMSPSATSLE